MFQLPMAFPSSTYAQLGAVFSNTLEKPKQVEAVSEWIELYINEFQDREVNSSSDSDLVTLQKGILRDIAREIALCTKKQSKRVEVYFAIMAQRGDQGYQELYTKLFFGSYKDFLTLSKEEDAVIRQYREGPILKPRQLLFEDSDSSDNEELEEQQPLRKKLRVS